MDWGRIRDDFLKNRKPIDGNCDDVIFWQDVPDKLGTTAYGMIQMRAWRVGRAEDWCVISIGPADRQEERAISRTAAHWRVYLVGISTPGVNDWLPGNDVFYRRLRRWLRNVTTTPPGCSGTVYQCCRDGLTRWNKSYRFFWSAK